jgi:hypothetical protein
MSEIQEPSELAVQWGLTEEELQEVLIKLNEDPEEEDPMEWSVYGNYGYGYIPDFGALHYPPPTTDSSNINIDYVTNEETDVVTETETAKTHVVSHFARMNLTESGKKRLGDFFVRHNINNMENFTMWIIEEADIFVEPSTAEKLQDHLGDLMRWIWGMGMELRDNLSEDFPIFQDHEKILSLTETIIKINDMRIHEFCQTHSLSNMDMDELDSIIEEENNGYSGTDAIYLEMEMEK